MAFILNPGLLGALDKIEQANILSASEIADLRAIVRDCRDLDSLCGVNVHQLAEEKRKAAKAKLVEAIEDSLYLFSDRTIANELNDVKRLVEKRRKATKTNEYLVYYSIAYMVAVTGADENETAIEEYAKRVGRDVFSVHSQFYKQKKKLGIK